MIKLEDCSSVYILYDIIIHNGYKTCDVEKILKEYIITTDPDEVNTFDPDQAIVYFKGFFDKKDNLISILNTIPIKEVTKKNALKYINRGFNLLRDSVDRIYNLSTVRGLILGEIGISSTVNANTFYNAIKEEIINIVGGIEKCINDEDLDNEPHIDF